MQQFASEKAQAAIDQMHDEYNGRLSTLESVVKQADFERLSFVDRTSKELVSLRQDFEQVQSCNASLGQGLVTQAQELTQANQKLCPSRGELQRVSPTSEEWGNLILQEVSTESPPKPLATP